MGGPVHAPLFPEPKFEEWWIFLLEQQPSARIIAFERIRDCERVVEEKLRFQVSRIGKHNLVLHALCDSYAGIDQKVELNFTAHTEDEVKREVFVHPEDEELDLQPTLFQQFMGELNREEESEEEDDAPEKPKKGKRAPEASAAAKATENTAESDGDGEGDDEKKKDDGKGDDDDSSDSSSDSD